MIVYKKYYYAKNVVKMLVSKKIDTSKRKRAERKIILVREFKGGTYKASRLARLLARTLNAQEKFLQ